MIQDMAGIGRQGPDIRWTIVVTTSQHFRLPLLNIGAIMFEKTATGIQSAMAEVPVTAVW